MVASMADHAMGSAAPQTAPAGTSPADTAAPAAASVPGELSQEAAGSAAGAAESTRPGFGARGRMRRRLRFLRKARELAYRDLGGLVYEMQRLGERHDELAAAKLATLAAIDTELRALQEILDDHRPVTVLREAGIAACPRCAAIHGSEDHFCPACGLSMGRRADRPIATTTAGPTVLATAPPMPAPVPPASTPPASVPPTPLPAQAPTRTPAAATPPPAAASPSSPSAPTSQFPIAQPPAPPAPAGGSPAGATSPPATSTPATAAPASRYPTVAQPPQPPETPASDDRPTEIIRPSDQTPGRGA
jgi:hypothetical protein